MKKISILFVLLFSMVSTAQAAVAIDPTTGLSSYFTWSGGLGSIDTIDGTATSEWSIDVASDSIMTMATAYDGFVVGDEFALVVDGSVVAWTSTFADASGYFHGVYDDLFLSAGSHTISLTLTALAPGFTSGGAYADFSAVTVPEASSLALLFLGLAGLGFTRKKKSV